MDGATQAGSGTQLGRLAPAKINLCLHIVGQRPADGYHLLESLVVFADEHAADRVRVTPAEADAFRIIGPYGAPLATEADNLVIKARDWLRARHGGAPVALELDKRLPVASGIGGGSADAAATLQLLADLWNVPDAIAPAAYAAICTTLGADVAMCLQSKAVLAHGIGEELTPVAGLPALPAVLINPGVGVATGSVFGALASKSNPALPALPDRWGDVHDVASWLAAKSRNDLEPPARAIAPAMDACLAALNTHNALLARMSGSGATCFGLYATRDAARHAASQIMAAEPDWWVRASMLNADTSITTATAAEKTHVQA